MSSDVLHEHTAARYRSPAGAERRRDVMTTDDGSVGFRWPLVMLDDHPAAWRALSSVVEHVTAASGRLTVCHVVDTSLAWRFAAGSVYCLAVLVDDDDRLAGEALLERVRAAVPYSVPVTTRLLVAPEPKTAQIAKAYLQSPLCDALVLTDAGRVTRWCLRREMRRFAGLEGRPVVTVAP